MADRTRQSDTNLSTAYLGTQSYSLPISAKVFLVPMAFTVGMGFLGDLKKKIFNKGNLRHSFIMVVSAEFLFTIWPELRNFWGRT